MIAAINGRGHKCSDPGPGQGRWDAALSNPHQGARGVLLAAAGLLLRAFKPKLRPIRQAIRILTWRFAGSTGWRSGYFKVSGIGAPMSSKACRWVLVGSVSICMVTSVPAYRTWLRVSVARCSIRPRKLR
jgi:hypothetical protein